MPPPPPRELPIIRGQLITRNRNRQSPWALWGQIPFRGQENTEARRDVIQNMLPLLIRGHLAVPMEIEPLFDAAALGLKEIGNLASWTVSTFKPGCGVDALRDDNTDMFWQCVNSLPSITR